MRLLLRLCRPSTWRRIWAIACEAAPTPRADLCAICDSADRDTCQRCTQSSFDFGDVR